MITRRRGASSSSSSCGVLPQRFSPCILVGLSLFLLKWNQPRISAVAAAVPRKVHLRAAVFTNTVPLAYYVEDPIPGTTAFPYANFQGYQPDLLREVQKIAKELDNITLTIEMEIAPGLSDYAPNLFYDQSLNYIADDCDNTTTPIMPSSTATNNINNSAAAFCDRFDFYVADYYAIADRSVRVLFTPAMLTTAAVAVKYAHRTRRDISTIEEAQALNEAICVLEDSFYDRLTIARYPNAAYIHCHSHGQCVGLLKEERCGLFVEDRLQLKYLVKQDPDLVITREQFNEQFVAWPLNKRTMDLELQVLFVKWIYHAKASGIMDALYDKYFSIDFCPIGKAGEDCARPCSPSHGIADRYGDCICESTKWTGDDCSEEVFEDKNMIPKGLLYASYVMVGINVITVLYCGWWLRNHLHRAQVKAAQPSFLVLVLLGCLISTSTILAFAQEDEGDGPVVACMAVPWLYSIGFCITFGALFAKIRRVYRVFQNAAQMRRIKVSVRETAAVVGAVLTIDMLILLVWTIFDPLYWQRMVISEDKYGEALSSEGHCTSEHWRVFASILAIFHFLLIAVACYMCYLTKDLPARFADSKWVAMAIFSNLQVFVVGLPVLIILGAEPGISFFVRSVMVFINDWVVVVILFGNLIYAVYHWDRQARMRSTLSTSRASLQSDIQLYAKHVRGESDRLSGVSCQTSRYSKTLHSNTTHSIERNNLEEAAPWDMHGAGSLERTMPIGSVTNDIQTSALSEEIPSHAHDAKTSHIEDGEISEKFDGPQNQKGRPKQKSLPSVRFCLDYNDSTGDNDIHDGERMTEKENSTESTDIPDGERIPEIGIDATKDVDLSTKN